MSTECIQSPGAILRTNIVSVNQLFFVEGANVFSVR
jgi:hypothetical protein